MITPLSNLPLNAHSTSVTVNTGPATNNFINFEASSLQDTLVAMVSNIDYQFAVDSSQSTSSFQYTVYTDGTSGPIPISSDYSAKLTVNNSNNWLSANFLNNQLVRIDTLPPPVALKELDYAYPTPFYYSRNSQIFIPVSVDNNGVATCNIYSSSLSLVYSASTNVFSDHGHSVVAWNARSNTNEKLTSGVYIYVTKSGDNVVKGKLVIFN